MNDNLKWINQKIILGWIMVAAGLVVGVIGILLPKLAGSLPFNTRIITGLGILISGWGIANLVRYGVAGRDKQAAMRLVSEERDERLQIIRARAGSRAYWVSAAMAYTGFCLYPPFRALGFFSAGTDWVGGLMNMRVIHYFGMWVIILFTAVHAYLANIYNFAPSRLIFLWKETPEAGAATDRASLSSIIAYAPNSSAEASTSASPRWISG